MKDRKQPETLRLRSVMPALTVNDLDASTAWYRDVLGFVVESEHEADGNRVAASVQAGTVRFLLAQDDGIESRGKVCGSTP